MEALVSVIVPIYNVEEYLEKCIDSILNQTYRNIEVILVDDGSPDNCGKICDEYAKKDTRIKVIHKENGGLSDARNAGIDIANGEYLLFVDSDDYIAPQMVETLYNAIIADGSDMALCNFTYVDEVGNELEEKNRLSPIKNEILSTKQILMKLVEKQKHYYTISWSKLYKKDTFKGIRFPKGKINEDEFVVHRIFDKCNTISCVVKPLYFYVQRSFSIMNSSYSVKRLDAVEAYLDRICYFVDKGLNEAAEKTAYIALQVFQYAHKNLDLNEVKSRNRYFELLRQFKKVYLNKLIKKVGLRANLHFSVFCVSIKLYNLLKNTHSLMLKARKVGALGCIKRILRKHKNAIGKLLRTYEFNNKLKKKNRILRKKFDIIVFIIATPCHGNLGDHAIVYAEHKILNDSGHKQNVVEISNNDYKNYKNILKNYICEDDILIIDGGGNLGTLWPCEDDKISEIISTYKNNKIIIFPQTCYYGKDSEAEKRLQKNKEIYANAKNLTISLRDKKSYEFCCDNFSGPQFLLVPDIVLSLEKDNLQKKRDRCLLCFRKDIEKVLSDQDKIKITSYLDEHNIYTEKTSTIYPQNVAASEREQRLNEIWSNISGAKLLLTDRLHAMLFAAITGTPCLAMDNESKKVSGVYEWISKLEYIKVCSSVEEMIKLIPDFYNMEHNKYESLILSKEFDKLKCLLK